MLSEGTRTELSNAALLCTIGVLMCSALHQCTHAVPHTSCDIVCLLCLSNCAAYDSCPLQVLNYELCYVLQGWFAMSDTFFQLCKSNVLCLILLMCTCAILLHSCGVMYRCRPAYTCCYCTRISELQHHGAAMSKGGAQVLCVQVLRALCLCVRVL